MKWIKKDRIFIPNNQNGWINHSQGVTVLERNDCLRLYFSTRPKPDISLPVYVDVDKSDFTKIIRLEGTPLLNVGGPGDFDEFGIITTDIINIGDRLAMYYTGWSRGITTSYHLAIGVAFSYDGGDTFQKGFQGPILQKTRFEPYMAMASNIVFHNGIYHMFYGSGIGFYKAEPKYEPRYIIKYAYSKDGIEWVQPNKTIIPPLDDLEANTKPTVIFMDEKWHMWFCYRSSEDFRNGSGSYRIGYAYSDDLLDWTRNDKLAGISPSAEGWDSLMITYPTVKAINGKIYMFYNGNGFGATGFGYAELDVQ